MKEIRKWVLNMGKYNIGDNKKITINHKKFSVVISIILGICASVLIASIPCAFFADEYEIAAIITFFSLLIIFIPVMIFLMYKWLKPKYKFIIDGKRLIFEKLTDSHEFIISNIINFELLRYSNSIVYYINFYGNNLDKESIALGLFIPKGVIKKVTKKIFVPFVIINEVYKPTREERFKSYKEKIFENKAQIIASIVGAIISALCFIFNYKFNKYVWVPILLSGVSFFYGYFHLAVVYLSGKNVVQNRIERIILGFFGSIILICIFFGVVTLFFTVGLKLEFNINYLYYSFYLYPSFVIVIAVGLLILAGM